MEGLHVIKGVLPVLDYETSEKILNAINPLLVFAGLDLRLGICDVLDGLAITTPSLTFLVTITSYYLAAFIFLAFFLQVRRSFSK